MPDNQDNEFTIIVPADINGADNPVRAIYDKNTTGILDGLGDTEITRASHVEPGSTLSLEALNLLDPKFTEGNDDSIKIKNEFKNNWFVDLTPSGINRVLGPYNSDARNVALADEHRFLLTQNIPVNKT